MAAIDEFLEANAQYAATFDRGDLPMPPRRRVAVLTCMDARLHPEKFLGLDVGDAHVIRNAGGRASQDAIRSLVISQRLLGTNEIVVIHHTDCGMLTFRNADLSARIRAELGVDASGWDFLPFSDLEASVRDDVAVLRRSPLIPRDIPISGAIYDVRTGRLQEVVREAGARQVGTH
ncbi:MAG TPA: carbonic anhydrase [Roseiflexaceae bacterium]|nr:carbonic anhydrase [Roseiflexaceae bacterium]